MSGFREILTDALLGFATLTVVLGRAVLRFAFGVFYGLGDAPGEDPRMAAEANEETGERVGAPADSADHAPAVLGPDRARRGRRRPVLTAAINPAAA